ncbi:IS21 family transposase [Candidatus Poribacteria bacterium]|nr:IS21 family transposase [Candidatus Poribacteria bacterium]
MANTPISMDRIRRIVQLRSEGTSKLKISKAAGIHRSILDKYLLRLEMTGKSYPELLLLEDADLASIVYTEQNTQKPDNRLQYLQKQFTYYTEQLRLPGVTRRILWEEYKQSHPDGYGYTQFCEHFARYNRRNKATMHFDHRAGEYLQVDFAGKPLHIVDRYTGEIVACPILVCVLPFSNYPYIEALPSTKQEYLFAALNRCMEYLGGVPRNILSDNMKQYIKKNERYEFTFSELVNQWSVHYNTNLEATRINAPKDKPSVEGGVYISYLRIHARLRNEIFHDLRELNQRIRELTEAHVRIPFQKQNGSRFDLFVEQEQSCLKPLPATPFVVKHTTTGKVHMNYHVVLGEDNHRYSVPYKYIGQKTRIVYDTDYVEIFIGFSRIALHRHNYQSGGYTTLEEHMPDKHRKYQETLGWDADYFLSQAEKIGQNAVEVFKRVLASREFVEQSYLSCKGLKRLTERYSPDRFEAACRRALKGTRVNYNMIKNILEKNLDQQEDIQEELFSIPRHNNIRGKESYK